MVFDPVRQRFLVFGGNRLSDGARFDDVWERPLASTTEWVPLAVTGAAPAARSGHSAVYDPIGDRLLVFGGQTPSAVDDVWALSLGGTPAWSPITPDGTSPAPRYGHTAVFDAARNRMVVFGGATPALSNEVWFLDFATPSPAWQLASIPGAAPAGRLQHVALLDTAHDRMVVTGGLGATYYSDVWTLSLGATPAWTQRLALSAPGPRSEASGVLDVTGNRALVFGGRLFSNFFADLWSLDLDGFTWASEPTTGPASRRLAAMAIDPVSRKAILQGGATATQSLDDTWALGSSPATLWTRVFPAIPPPPPVPPPPPSTIARRYGASGIFDTQRGRFLLIGGGYDVNSQINYVGEISELVMGRDSFFVRAYGPSSIVARIGQTAIYDSNRDRLVLFGGYAGGYFNDLVAVSLSPAMAATPITPIGPVPSVRDFCVAVYDPVGDRMVLYGGNGSGGFLSDLWELTFSTPIPTWNLLSPSGPSPGGLFGARAVYDPTQHRMLLFGGYSDGTSRNAVFGLSLSGPPVWTPMATIGTAPDGRHNHSLALDANRQRLLVYGGIRQENSFRYSDAWELPLGSTPAWRMLSPAGSFPLARYGHVAMVDPVNDRMLVSGGVNNGTLGDVWRLQFSNDDPTAALTSLITAEARHDAVSLRWDVVCGSAGCELQRRDEVESWRTIDHSTIGGSCVVAFTDRDVEPGARYAYRLVVHEANETTTSSEVWVDIPGAPRFALHGFSPNPASGAARVAFSLASSEPATLEVVDIGGRRLTSRRIESPAPGTASLEVAPAGGLAPGLYFIRLRQGARTVTVRGTVVR